MNRHFYISDDLDDLERVEEELEDNGISTPHIHVLSLNDAEVAHHKHLHEVEAVLRTDVVRGTKIGALIGMFSSSAVITLTYLLDWAPMHRQDIFWMSGQNEWRLPWLLLSSLVSGE